MARPLSEHARAKMLEAAHDVIVEEGLDACTVDEVARRSGVAKTTIYRHFTNADDLAVAAIDRMAATVDIADTGALDSDLRLLVAAFDGLLRTPAARRTFVSLLHRALDDPQFERSFRRSREMEHAPLRRVLQRGIARGEIDPEIDLDVAIEFVKAPFVLRYLLGVEDTLADHDVDAVIELVCRALAPVPARVGRS